MMELFLAWGPLGLVVAAFLAGSILPLPSEAVLGGLVAAGAEPWGLVCIASIANTVGAASLVLIGRKGRPYAVRKLGEVRIAKYEKVFERYGSILLLLGFLPIAGDAFILIAGVLGVPWSIALPLVFVGKAARYIVVALGARAFVAT